MHSPHVPAEGPYEGTMSRRGFLATAAAIAAMTCGCGQNDHAEQHGLTPKQRVEIVERARQNEFLHDPVTWFQRSRNREKLMACFGKPTVLTCVDEGIILGTNDDKGIFVPGAGIGYKTGPEEDTWLKSLHVDKIQPHGHCKKNQKYAQEHGYPGDYTIADRIGRQWAEKKQESAGVRVEFIDTSALGRIPGTHPAVSAFYLGLPSQGFNPAPLGKDVPSQFRISSVVDSKSRMENLKMVLGLELTEGVGQDIALFPIVVLAREKELHYLVPEAQKVVGEMNRQVLREMFTVVGVEV